jgi:hypothetical protein
MGTTDETALYLLSRLRSTRKAIKESVPEANCKAHQPMADGVACLLECKELEIEADQRREAEAKSDNKFGERVKVVAQTVIAALGSAGILKVLS